MWVEFFGRFVGGGGCYIFIHHDIKTYTFLTTTEYWYLYHYTKYMSTGKIYFWRQKKVIHYVNKEMTSTCTLNIHLIILGNKSLSDDENVKILKAVHTFIQNCGRFN